MNDKELKIFLRKDKSQPDAAVNEWQQIQSQIETENAKSWKYIFRNTLFGVPALMVVFAVITSSNNQSLDKETVDLMQFMISDSYFEEESETYSWIE